MGAKTRRRFIFESGSYYSVPIRPAGQRRYRLIPFEDEEYDGDDEREVKQIMAEDSCSSDWSEVRQDLDEADECVPHRKKRKLELTAHEREKAAFLAYPDPWASTSTDEDNLETLCAGLLATDAEAWAPLPDLLELSKEAKDGQPMSDQARKGETESCYKSCEETRALLNINLDLVDTDVNGLFNYLANAVGALNNQGPPQEEVAMPQPES